jgi:tellurite resistance protein TehA-like permease
MDKSKLNFVIDALMFLCIMAMAGLGFLIKYILPPGREVAARYGRNLFLTWLGWDRHDWGDIHLYLAFTLLSLLTLHLILHWHLIPGLFARLVPHPRWRFRIALIFLLLSLLLIYFPFLITPDMQPRGRGGGRRSQAIHSEVRVAGAVHPGGLNVPASPLTP